MLQQTFIELCNRYTSDRKLIKKLWGEITNQYLNSKRYYHNLSHLENLLNQLTDIKSEIKNWEAILFALYYHDIIYSSLKSNNEKLSAAFAKKALKKITVPENTIDKCYDLIIATKGHSKSKVKDINIFTDCDLSILGASWPVYLDYTVKIRKEYSIYPDFIYNKGRIKVIQHFLAMEAIYKTALFSEKYEKSARKNLNKELQLLSK